MVITPIVWKYGSNLTNWWGVDGSIIAIVATAIGPTRLLVLRVWSCVGATRLLVS
ncbi:hypothetical protein HanHA300_Chr06g0208081 [Helianthus annuus]|nr:hypothetical protein HanHA300_Chr06g0208081 [Helianthus annuus]KAJ0573130.1 hypothetical protein HanHA89_Chr06g0223381 [Helianthus annuus]KAJ0737549.1 hypothetical protein HanLR1_Chr06g0208241 [Helianthus annuus]